MQPPSYSKIHKNTMLFKYVKFKKYFDPRFKMFGYLFYLLLI